MRGKRVLVTGASSGVGEATARAFAAEGASVALLARRADRLEAIGEELGDDAHGFPVDVSDADAVATAVAAANEALGGLDVAVNAAGIAHEASLKDIAPADWRQMIDVNLSGTFYVAREAALLMLAAGDGSIVNIGSDLASMGHAGFAHYGAAKAGVVGLTKNLAAELAPTVRVNVVCPGPIDTPMMEAELAHAEDPEAARREGMAGVPMGRFAAPEEIVAAIRLFAVEAPFATGAVLPVDGGTTVV
ncbi:MAG: SDR family oxidoreductase [Actinobacteria bacterium]|nr:SDR family oxidoreductase [Actinomycetota bacterium]